MGLLLLLVAAAWCLRLLDARPLVLDTRHRQQIGMTTVGAVDFLIKYGYLPSTSLEADNLRTEEQLKVAIKAMQLFAGIPQTGEVDERTMNLMKSPRCGNSDFVTSSHRIRRYALQGGKWDHLNITWSITDSAETLDYQTTRDELSRAFNVWSRASRLTFIELPIGAESDISISFFRGYHGDGYSFDGPGSVLAHAFFPGPGVGGDTHFDDEEAWDASTRKDSTGISLFAVAAHEFGHSLGLSHSRERSALMYPYYQWIQDDFVLPEDDQLAIHELYGYIKGKINSKPIYPRPIIPSHTTRLPPTSGYIPFPSAASPNRNLPNTCDTNYDAISLIRGELFIFKGKYFWRLNDRGVEKDYPVEINRFWYHLPKDIKRIDAVYERPKDKKIIFFIRKQYWLFNGNMPEPGYPKSLTSLGLPANLNKIDAAMVWGHNGKTYFFSGKQYWLFDESEGKVDLDYPRDMCFWKKVPYNIDAAFQWIDKKTYFFKKKYYWRFNDAKMRAEKGRSSALFWMKCPKVKKLLIDSRFTISNAREHEFSYIQLMIFFISALLIR